MRVIVVGGAGTIGSAVVAALSARHAVVVVGRKSGTVHVDLASPDSIRAMFQSVGTFDAVISAAGQAKFGSLDELTDADYQFSFSNKLMGQVNLVRIGRQWVFYTDDRCVESGADQGECLYQHGECWTGRLCPSGRAGAAAWDTSQCRESTLGDGNACCAKNGSDTRHARCACGASLPRKRRRGNNGTDA